MRCKEAYVCLLGAQYPAKPPLALRRHLADCAKCRQRQRRLQALEAEFQRDLLGEVPAAARTAILERIAADAPAPIAIPMPPHRQQRRRPGLPAVAALLLVALGIGLGWGLARWQPPADPVGTVAAARGAQEATVGRLLESDLRLAEVSTAPEQVAALADMAAELSKEALRLAQDGPADDVLLVSELYERVVCQGLVKRAQALPAGEQAEFLRPLTDQLEQTAQAAGTTRALAGAAPGLRVLGDAARGASRSLSAQAPLPAPRNPAWQPARSGTVRDLLGTMVVQGLRLAEEDDPLRRADYCTDVADHLVQGILLASAGGDTQRADCLSGFLGSVMDRGVAINLERFHATEPDDERREEAERIGGRSAKAMEVLQRNLKNAPAAAQAGLQRALQAGKGRNTPETKGPPRGLFPDKLPPGLQKKQQREKN